MNVEQGPSMKPSEVRYLIGHQHLQLRILFVEVENACREQADPRPVILRLVKELREHLAMEDRVLVPALREVDGWGAVRADRVATDHAQQREQLAALRQLAREGPPQAAGAAALALIADLIIDMDGEERDLLSPDLLRDDPVAIDQSSG
jgi:hypothetical protein